MTAVILVPLVMATIFLMRNNLGNATYDKIVIAFFKWAFLTLGVVILFFVIYNCFIR